MAKRGGSWLSRKKLNVPLLLLALLPCACEQQDTERLARVARKAGEKAQAITGVAEGKLTNGLQAVRAGWDEMALDARVAMRLRWDKALADARIQVQVDGNAILLKGTVAQEDQKRRAVELAEATVGVDKVTDALLVGGEE
jgi:osmotically-inducible protein OsmY